MTPSTAPLSQAPARIAARTTRHRSLQILLATALILPLNAARANLLDDLSGVLAITCEASVLLPDLEYLCQVRETLEQISPILDSGKWAEFGKDPLAHMDLISQSIGGVSSGLSALGTSGNLVGDLAVIRGTADALGTVAQGRYESLADFGPAARTLIGALPGLQDRIKQNASAKGFIVKQSGQSAAGVRESNEAVTNASTVVKNSVEAAAKVLAPGLGKADALALRLKGALSTRDAIDVQTEASIELLRQTAYSNTNVVNMLSSSMVQGAVTNAQLSQLVSATYLQIDREMNEVTDAINGLSTDMQGIRDASAASQDMANGIVRSMVGALEVK